MTILKKIPQAVTLFTALMFCTITFTPLAQAATKIKYALGDVISIDELPLLVAVARAKKRGVDIEITAFKSEEIATQAVINGQADIGQGSPYAAVQKVKIPIRFFFQLNSLQFFPIVNKEYYKNWKDLDGQDIVVHARGSGTEAIMNLMAKEHKIRYKNMSYVPGSSVRALGLLKGNIKASILNSFNKNYVMREAPDKFMLLPLGQVKASDEALFATKAFLQKNHAAVTIFLEELIKVNREINANPKSILDQRKKLGLLKDLPSKIEQEILPLFEEGVSNKIFPGDGGGMRAAQSDLKFYRASGALTGENLKTEDFWEFVQLNAALGNLK